jgi:ParB family chromosome partitioning protein
LPESVRKALAEGRLREGQARPLINLDDALIEKILPKILKEEWSARAIEQYVNDLRMSGGDTEKKNPELVVPERRYQAESKVFAKRFATPVQVKSNARGAGQIVIKFKSEDEFKRISKLLED